MRLSGDFGLHLSLVKVDTKKYHFISSVECRVRTGLESQGKNGNLGLSQGKSGNFFQSLEKLGFVGKVREKL